MRRIKFNEPFITGNEITYMNEVIASRSIAGNGQFTKKCQHFFENRWDFKQCLFTHSGTGALEMAAILLNIGPGDEVIVPSYTFPTTALAFKRQGAKIVFVDVKESHPCLDESLLENLITVKTKAIVVVHYGGVSCHMDHIITLSQKYNIPIVEDAAQAIGGMYKKRALGGLGSIGCYSFHESKNIHCGEGGMLVVNHDSYIDRAEIIWEKGTNRSAFLNGKVKKYECVDLGSSYLPSELQASFLFAQLEQMDSLIQKRNELWNLYFELLSREEYFDCPYIPPYATHNSHVFYITVQHKHVREKLINHLKKDGISAVFHYQSLHNSPFFRDENSTRTFPNSDKYTNCLVRLPLHHQLTKSDIHLIVSSIRKFYKS